MHRHVRLAPALELHWSLTYFGDVIRGQQLMPYTNVKFAMPEFYAAAGGSCETGFCT